METNTSFNTTLRSKWLRYHIDQTPEVFSWASMWNWVAEESILKYLWTQDMHAISPECEMAISIHRASECRKKSITECQRMKVRSARKQASRWPSSTFMPTRGAPKGQRIREQARTRPAHGGRQGKARTQRHILFLFPHLAPWPRTCAANWTIRFLSPILQPGPRLLVSKVNAWKASPERENHTHLMSYIFKFLWDESKQMSIWFEGKWNHPTLEPQERTDTLLVLKSFLFSSCLL